MWRKIMWIYPSPLAAKTQMRSQMITNQIKIMIIIFVTAITVPTPSINDQRSYDHNLRHFYFVQISPSPLMYLMYMYLVCPVAVANTLLCNCS